MKNESLPAADEKFLFHMHVFDEDEVEEEEEIEEDLPPPPPTFSEEELEAAKQEAYERGHSDATAESKASRSQAVAETLQAISDSVQNLFAQEQLRESIYEKETVALSRSIFEKLFPVYQREYGFKELTEQIETVLQDRSGEKAIRIRVAPDYVEGVSAFMKKLSDTNTDFNFVVDGDATLNQGAAVLSWEDGGAVRDAEHMSEQILNRIEELLAGSATTRHDEDDESSRTTPADATLDTLQDHAEQSQDPIAEDDNE